MSSISTSTPPGPKETGQDVIVVVHGVGVAEQPVETCVEPKAFNRPANVCLTVMYAFPPAGREHDRVPESVRAPALLTVALVATENAILSGRCTEK